MDYHQFYLDLAKVGLKIKKLNFDQGIGLKISKKEIKITKNTEKTITLLQYFACVGPLPTSHHISSENYTK